MPLSFCDTICGPNNKNKQTNMLNNRYQVPYPKVPEKFIKNIQRHEMEREKAVAKSDEEIAAAVAQLPSIYQMVKNLGRHALKVVAHYKKTGRVKITDEHQQARTTECLSCENHRIDDRENLRCALRSCGCHLTGDLGRLGFEALPCDIGKHDEIDKQFIKE